jgi:hypothetical protein
MFKISFGEKPHHIGLHNFRVISFSVSMVIRKLVFTSLVCCNGVGMSNYRGVLVSITMIYLVMCST